MRKLLIILALMLPAAVFAQDARVLTLDEAVAIAMEKNKSIEQAKEYMTYLQGIYVEERSAALPKATLYGGVSRNRDASTGSAVNSDVYNSYNAGVSVKQALFTWGQVGAAIRAAKIGLRTGDEQLRLYRQAAVRDVNVAFTDILLTKQLLFIAEENVKQRQRHLDEAEKKYKLGTATDYDVLSARVALKNAQPDVISYRNSLTVARDNLKFILGVDYEVEVQGELKPADIKPADYDSALKSALANRPEILDKKLMVDFNRELVQVSKAGDKPRVDFSGSFDRIKLDGEDEKNLTNWSAGVNLSFPFFDGMATKGKIIQAESDLRRTKLQQLQAEDSVSLDVRQAVSRVKEAVEVIEASEGTVSEAEKLLDMAEKGYRFGVKTKLDVDDAEYNLRSSRVRLAQAWRDYRVQYANLLWSAGIIGEKKDM
ncbi:TolC family protein [Seleniivibrio woodruffii]|uniref:Outer membrane protein TolC n=1 Tax=Seleniivibrio woodruffii TaxID=1078050 RepID=A0A4R1KCJ6_9BACT|nr:TolC family protein [Seleniivibrio woodruffii]TCK60889.1 outer membrane protein TolC [Seleniivibrio woodruffii]TVZ36519.1 HAE1 family hydrophobic/amphiphilic exporter-1 [Seleniivibrio woodruffii]